MHRFLPVLIIVTVAFAYLYLPIRREIAYKLNISGDPTTSCCNVNEVLRSSGKFEESASVAFFNGQIIDYPKTSLARALQNQQNNNILGTKNTAGEEKWIEVSLGEQKLRAWEGNRVVMEFLISSGRWAPTPTGDFSVWYKTRFQSMIGGSPALGTYYNLPNVPYNMFFYNGYAIHGAYWHNNFGRPMSHGCVNSPVAQAAQLFDWTGPVVAQNTNVARATQDNPGTRVYVH